MAAVSPSTGGRRTTTAGLHARLRRYDEPPIIEPREYHPISKRCHDAALELRVDVGHLHRGDPGGGADFVREVGAAEVAEQLAEDLPAGAVVHLLRHVVTLDVTEQRVPPQGGGAWLLGGEMGLRRDDDRQQPA